MDGFNLHVSDFQNDVTTKDNDKDFTKGREGLLVKPLRYFAVCMKKSG